MYLSRHIVICDAKSSASTRCRLWI